MRYESRGNNTIPNLYVLSNGRKFLQACLIIYFPGLFFWVMFIVTSNNLQKAYASICHCWQPSGSYTARKITFCSWTCWKIKGQQRFSGYGGRALPTREAVCLHCVWTLWTMLSQTTWGSGLINHSVIGPAPVIIHPRPLILADVKLFLHEPPPSLSVWTLSLGFCPGRFFFLITSSYWSKLSVLFSVQRENNPLSWWNGPKY